MRISWLVVAVLSTLGWVLLAPPGPVRLVCALFLFFAAPGLGFGPVVGFRGEWWWWVIGVLGISLVTDVIVAQAVTYTVGFAWRPCAVGLAGVTCAGLLLNAIGCVHVHPDSDRSREEHGD